MQLPDLGAWGLWGLLIGTFLAATIVPFSADVLYITVLQMTSNPWACLAVAALGNWLGNLTTYGLGRLGKWDWIEKHTKVTRAQLEKQKGYFDKLVTTNLTYQPPELMEREWFEVADMSKYAAMIIDFINHDISLSSTRTPTEKIHKILAKINRHEQTEFEEMQLEQTEF